MPVYWSKYPEDWKTIAQRVKEQAGWKCQQCDRQCRQPGEEFDTHRRTLTVAHINHVESDVRDENLVALCPNKAGYAAFSTATDTREPTFITVLIRR